MNTRGQNRTRKKETRALSNQTGSEATCLREQKGGERRREKGRTDGQTRQCMCERKEEREKEKGMEKEEASLVCEDMGKELSP